MIRPGLIIAVCMLPGCNSADLDHRPGAWHPNGSNAANIAAMAADPHDLIRGRRGETDSRQAADAITRLWQAKAKPQADGSGGAAVASEPAPSVGGVPGIAN
jgi:hypothetical protein